MNAWIWEYKISDNILSSHVCPHSILFLPGTSAPKSGQHITKYPLYKDKLCYILPLLGKNDAHVIVIQNYVKNEYQSISVNTQINYLSSSYRKHTLLQCDVNPQTCIDISTKQLHQSLYNKNLKEIVCCNNSTIYHPS